MKDFVRDIDDHSLTRHSINDEDFLLEIFDYQMRDEEFFTVNANSLRRYQGFLCTYDITSRSSFEWINVLCERILLMKDDDKVPMILVGNKCDLEEDRKVSRAEGEELASLEEVLSASHFEQCRKTSDPLGKRTKEGSYGCRTILKREVRHGVGHWSSAATVVRGMRE